MATSTPPISNARTSADQDLIAAVRQALCDYDPTRMWDETVQVDAESGVVTLSGSVRNHSTREVAENLARRVKGVTQIKNNLLVDLDLELAVAQALAVDPRTQALFPGVLVGVVFGAVNLKGQAETEQVKQAAGEIAGKIPGVRAVSNQLTVVAKGLDAEGKKPTLKPTPPAPKVPA